MMLRIETQTKRLSVPGSSTAVVVTSSVVEIGGTLPEDAKIWRLSELDSATLERKPPKANGEPRARRTAIGFDPRYLASYAFVHRQSR
jgi:hypothetical protein